MSAPKQGDIYGLMAEVAVTYGSTEVLAIATDGVALVEKCTITENASHAGEPMTQPGTLGVHGGRPMRGIWVEGAPKWALRGQGTNYSATQFVEADRFLRFSGHEPTLVNGVSWSFAPESQRSGMESGYLQCYSDEEQWDITHVYASMNWTLEGLGPMIFDFPFFGLRNALGEDAAEALTITYPTVVHPQGDLATVTIGGQAVSPSRIAFRMNRQIGNRARMVAGNTGHVGFAPGRRSPEIEITLEKTLFATLNLSADAIAGTDRAIVVTIGTAAFNRMTFTATLGRQTKPPESVEENGVSMWRATFGCEASSAIANDDYSLLFN